MGDRHGHQFFRVIATALLGLMALVGPAHAEKNPYEDFFREFEEERSVIERVVRADPGQDYSTALSRIRQERPRFDGSFPGLSLQGYLDFARAHQGEDISLRRYDSEVAREAESRAKLRQAYTTLALGVLGLAAIGIIHRLWLIRHRLHKLGRAGRGLIAGWILWPLASFFVIQTFQFDISDEQGLSVLLFPPAFATVATWLVSWVRKADTGQETPSGTPQPVKPTLPALKMGPWAIVGLRIFCTIAVGAVITAFVQLVAFIVVRPESRDSVGDLLMIAALLIAAAAIWMKGVSVGQRFIAGAVGICLALVLTVGGAFGQNWAITTAGMSFQIGFPLAYIAMKTGIPIAFLATIWLIRRARRANVANVAGGNG